MANVLDEILAHKRGEVEHARATRPVKALEALPGYAEPRRDFYAAVTTPATGIARLIAEVKQASPSAGLIRAQFDPVAIARQYEAGGAAALSVLTDEMFFGGRLEYIAAIKAAAALPVLRKDFLVDTYQIHESRAAGADAVLVIAEALDAPRIAELVGLARRLGLAVLLEVHTLDCLTVAIELIQHETRGGVLLGLNNRDLQTQRVDLATTERLARQIPANWPFVAESGIKTRPDVERLQVAGARALLVGETLMRSADPAATIRALFA